MPNLPPSPQSPQTPEAARRAIDAHWPRAPIEQRALGLCTGPILRQEVYAERDNPPFDRVCMDGVAIEVMTGAMPPEGTLQLITDTP